MQNWEYEDLRATGQVAIPQTEAFVTRSFEYQIHLWFETRLKYDILVVFLMQAGTEEAMRQYGVGAVSSSAVAIDPSLAHLESISSIPATRKHDVIHIKGEEDALTYGLRRNSAAIFNSRIITYFGVPL